MTVTEAIRAHLGAVPPGRPFATGIMAHHGSREAVDQALSRLAHSGEILRVARGIYVRPRVSPILGAVHPGPFEVAQAVVEAEGGKLAGHGAAWALKLGLTTQVMTSPTFLTDGSTRRIRLGKTLLTLRHASPREMRLAATPAGRALLALEWVGEPESPHQAIETIRHRLSGTEFAEFLEDACRARGWIARVARHVLAGVGNAS